MDKRFFLFIPIIAVVLGIFYFYPRLELKKPPAPVKTPQTSKEKGEKITPNVVSKVLSTQPLTDKNKKVILISLDTVKAGDLGIYGSKRNTSTNIDALGQDKEAIVFENAYTPVPETLPAHIAAFTGLYPKKTGYANNIDVNKNKKFTTISKIFRDNGYKTAGFYSSTVFSQIDYIDLGFDDVDPPLDYTWSDRTEISAEETNNKVFSWLGAHYQDNFFLWVHYYEAHNPYTPFCTKDLYSKGLKPTHPDYLDGSIKIADRRMWDSVTKADNDYLNAKYDEEIYCMDKQFANLISKLKSLKIYDDATIIVFGDHGESFDHKALFHGFKLYQSEVHIPLIIKSALIKAPSQDNVSLLDITPSLVDAYQLKVNGSLKFDGISLNKVREGYDRALYLETAGPYFMESNANNALGLITNNLKLIDTSKGLELYDINADLQEKNNLVKETSSQEMSKLTELLKAY